MTNPFLIQTEPRKTEQQLLLATVYEADAAGARLTFDGEDTPSQKKYPYLAGQTLHSGQRVVAARMSGTFVVIGALAD